MTEPSPPSADARYGNQATQRVLSLLALFGHGTATRGVTEVSKVTGMNKNMVHRCLTTLVEAGFLVKDVSGERYQLGFKILDLHVVDPIVDIRALARPTLEQLHDLTRESVFLSIIVGSNRVNVDSIEAQGRRVSLGQRGKAVPLHVTRMSLLLLAHLDQEQIDAYLAASAPLDRFDDVYPVTEKTTKKLVLRQIKELRGRNIETWQHPTRFDAAYISFPISGVEGRLHGIVTVGGPRERFDPDEPALQQRMLEIVERLRQQCGFLIAAPVVLTGAGS